VTNRETAKDAEALSRRCRLFAAETLSGYRKITARLGGRANSCKNRHIPAQSFLHQFETRAPSEHIMRLQTEDVTGGGMSFGAVTGELPPFDEPHFASQSYSLYSRRTIERTKGGGPLPRLTAH
jgi:hypothetical protein